MPLMAKERSGMGYLLEHYVNEVNDPSKQPAAYLRLAIQHFDDVMLRQIAFFTAKMSIKKYYPENYPSIEPLKSERLSIEELETLMKFYSPPVPRRI